MRVTTTNVKSILTRTSGYLKTVCSHSLQPYRGCSFGNSLCGAGCYVQHNQWLTRGEPWGSFVEARVNAASAYESAVDQERRWARASRGAFSVFLSSSTDPFLPHEQRFGITESVLRAMLIEPPDVLILQTHTARVTGSLDLLAQLSRRCDLRVHLSIESDRERLPGLPPPASSVAARLDAARQIRERGVRSVITVSPLLPIERPEHFLDRLAACVDAVVIDHFILGDGSRNGDGARTRATPLAAAMAAIDPLSVTLGYRDRIVAIAKSVMPGRVGVGIDGFAGRFAE